VLVPLSMCSPSVPGLTPSRDTLQSCLEVLGAVRNFIVQTQLSAPYSYSTRFECYLVCPEPSTGCVPRFPQLFIS